MICKDSRNLGENFEHAGVCSCNLGRNKIIVVKFGLNNEVYYSDATAGRIPALLQLRSIRHLVSATVFQSLVTALVLSRLDYTVTER